MAKQVALDSDHVGDTQHAISKALNEANLLVKHDSESRGTYTIRRRFQGRQLNVWAVKVADLRDYDEPDEYDGGIELLNI